ncbi:RING finger protein 37 [Fopius arisanus]|uniref:RING finger protein 37 n=2 Tax=Fopius arisanus TaxID=64838 RepID=A0A9R1TN48_9HYME|nr:PREDICTED: RING finger protein 37 [Fopius arisanus]
MLINFCQEFLKTTVTCDTISTECYEVENLLKNNSRGFLAYSCIKPPINIDFIFNCRIKINRIVIWPRIGAQKSSGFRVSVKSDRQDNFTIVSSCFLKDNEAGAVFWRSEGEKGPANFSSAFIGGNPLLLEKIKTLRLSIVKTEKSVPAVDRIEIWGFVSRWNRQDILGEMGELILKPLKDRLRTLEDEKTSRNGSQALNEPDEQMMAPDIPDIPDSYLDPITWNIMQQPVVLPSGKVIDQSTLEKYAESQGLWGRALSDPFTGVPFTETQRPVFASALKAKIDKFLSENSNLREIKSMPRLLGSNSVKIKNDFLDLTTITASTSSTCVSHDSTHNNRKNKLPIVSVIKQNSYRRKIPAVAHYSRENNSLEDKNSVIDSNNSGKNSGIDDNLESDLKLVMSSLKRFNGDKKSMEPTEGSMTACSCCELSNYYYKFPCNHFICRKAVISGNRNNLKCHDCGVFYMSSQIERIYR